MLLCIPNKQKMCAILLVISLCLIQLLVKCQTSSGFDRTMNVMLPQRDGKRPHITGRYGEQRSKGPHGGIDFNYNVPGQRGINKKHPVVNSPVSGKVTSIGKGYNTVNIRTPDGYNHQILHLNSVKVRPNNKVEAGKPIGTMGGKGPKGPTQYSQHVHYQIKDQKNRLVNPSEYHKNQFKTRQR